jgi:hypothetical protein
MEGAKTNHESKMRKTLSWIVGTDRGTRRIPKSSPGSNERPKSLLSFLPPILDITLVETFHRNSTPPNATVVNVQRPPLFFHSQPLPGTPETEHSRFTDNIADLSLSSLRSEEIARWKV